MSQLNDKDKRTVEYFQHYNQVAKYLRRVKNTKFSVGDILVKYRRSWSGEKTIYEPEHLSNKLQIPKKFKVIYIDDLDIVYVRQIKKNGKLGVALIPTITNDMDYEFFDADPDYAEHILFNGSDEGYNPYGDFKTIEKKRQDLQKYNESIRHVFYNKADVIDFFKNFKPGTTFWVSDGNECEYLSEYVEARVYEEKTWSRKTATMIEFKDKDGSCTNYDADYINTVGDPINTGRYVFFKKPVQAIKESNDAA